MSDFFYRLIRTIGRPIVFGAAHTLVLHEERSHLEGGCLLAANHHSYFDSMVLVGTTTRMIDWVSIVELFQKPLQKQFMTGINCLPLDRSRPDAHTARQIVKRLKAGRMVGLFPEAGLRNGPESIVRSGTLSPTVARLAEIGQAPIVPVVVLGADQFTKPKSWIPGAGTFLAVNYGFPMQLLPNASKPEARRLLETNLEEAFRNLFVEIQSHAVWQEKVAGPAWQENYFT